MFLSTQSAAVGITTDGATQQIHSRGVFCGLTRSVCPTPKFRRLVLFQVARVRMGQCTTAIDILRNLSAKDIDRHAALHITCFTATVHITARCCSTNRTATDDNIRPQVGSELGGIVVVIWESPCEESIAGATTGSKDGTANRSTLHVHLSV